MKTNKKDFSPTTPSFLQPLIPKYYLLDWDKVKDFEDFKKVFSTAVRLEIADNSTGFDDIKQFLKEKL